MTAPSTALCITHAPWRPERRASMQRLRDELQVERAPIEAYLEMTDRCPVWEWSEKQWRWGVDTGCDRILFLQDDAVTAPGFWESMQAMHLGAPEGSILGLEAIYPKAPLFALRGHRWYTSRDCLVGVGYDVARETMQDFLVWRETRLRAGGVEAITEDTLIACFCHATSRLIWHPIPTVIDHDTRIPSTYHNDHHDNRRPVVTWREWPEADRNDYRAREDIPAAGWMFGLTVLQLCARWVLPPGVTRDTDEAGPLLSAAERQRRDSAPEKLEPGAIPDAKQEVRIAEWKRPRAKRDIKQGQMVTIEDVDL